jgi:hypothetical protein
MMEEKIIMGPKARVQIEVCLSKKIGQMITKNSTNNSIMTIV